MKEANSEAILYLHIIGMQPVPTAGGRQRAFLNDSGTLIFE